MKGPRLLGKPLGLNEAANLHGVKAPDTPLKARLDITFADVVRNQGGAAELDGVGGMVDPSTASPEDGVLAEQGGGVIIGDMPSASPAKREHAGLDNMGVLTSLDVDLLITDRFQPRRCMSSDRLDELALSIKAAGGLNNPIIVRPAAGGMFEVVAGHRRLQATREILRERKIDALVRTLSDREALVVASMDNHDEPLTDYENGMSYRKMMDLGYFNTQTDLARHMGVSKAEVSRCIAYADLPESVHKILDRAPDLIGATAAAGLAVLVKDGYDDLVVEAVRLVEDGKAPQEQALRWAKYSASRVANQKMEVADVIEEAKSAEKLPTADPKPDPVIEKLELGGRQVATSSFQAKGKRLVLEFDDPREGEALFNRFKAFLAETDT